MYTGEYLTQTTNRTRSAAQGTLPSVLWQPGREGDWRRMDTCICMAELLSCSPETLTVLGIRYTPIQKKKEPVIKTTEEQTCSNFQASPEEA